MYNTLVSLHNWREDHIIRLVDSEASKLGIINAIFNIAQVDNSDDVFLFFFSGHGTHGEDLSPTDETDGSDEYICPWNSLTNSHENDIRDDEFEEILSYLDSNRRVVILDTCYSGGFPKAAEITIKTKPDVGYATISDGFDKDLNKAGYIVLTACDDNELSVEDGSLQNGVFTYYLVEGMNSGFPADTDLDEKVSAEESFDYTSPRTTAFNPDQHPQMYDGILGEVELTIPGNADVTRTRNLQLFELEPIADAARIRNLQLLVLKPMADMARTRNLQLFELEPIADAARIRNLQLSELKPNTDAARNRNLQLFEAKVQLPGDINGDYKVDHKDLLLLAGAYGSNEGEPNYDPEADIDNDGKVDHRDLLILAANYGQKDP
jgi:hypothetical protein